MESKITHEELVLVPPAPKTTRGTPSVLDISHGKLMYFNGCTVVVNEPTKEVKGISTGATITAAAISNSGTLVAMFDELKNFYIYELLEGKVRQFKLFQDAFPSTKCVVWNHDDSLVLIGGDSVGGIGGRVLNISTGNDTAKMSNIFKCIKTASFMPVKPYTLVVAGDEMGVKFYTGPPYEFSKEQRCHTKPVNQIRHNPDGSLLASVGVDCKIVLIGPDNKVVSEKNSCHQMSMMGVDWLNNNTLVTSSADCSIKFWNDKLEEIFKIKAKENSLSWFQQTVRASGQDIYTVSLNGLINVYKSPLTSKPTAPDSCFTGIISRPCNLHAYPQQNTFIVSTFDGPAYYYNQNTKHMCLLEHGKKQQPLITSSVGGNVLYQLIANQLLRKFDLTKKVLLSEEKLEGFNHIAACPNKSGRYVVADQARLVLFDNGKSQETKGNFKTVSLVYGQRAIALASSSGKITFFNDELKEIGAIDTGYKEIRVVKFDLYCDNLYISEGRNVYIWNWKTQTKEKDKIDVHSAHVNSIEVTKDYVITAGQDTNVVLSEKGKYKTITLKSIHRRGIQSVCLLGQDIVTVGKDLLIRVTRPKVTLEI